MQAATESSRGGSRIWELDFLRGAALILMIYFHTIYDMKEFYGYPVSYEGNINDRIGETSAILFILIAGICCSLSGSNFKRGLKVTGAAILVTLASYLYNPGMVIEFGILHFLGLSMLLSAVAGRLNKYLLLLSGTAIIILGYLTPLVGVNHNAFFILGITSLNFSTADYYPLIPWYGIFLYGMALGKELYMCRKSLFRVSPKRNLISAAGRHTLPVYLLHQPLILLVLKLVTIGG